MGKLVQFTVAADAMHFARTGDEYRVRDASPIEKANYPRPVDPKFPHLRTVVRRGDGATYACACPRSDTFADMCDDEIAGLFEADLDAAIGTPFGL